jgi:flagellar biosynthesis/type III secretory pathway protein FliH
MRTRFRHSTAGARPFHPADAAGPTDPEPAAAETDGGASAAPAQPEIDPATLETERRKAYQEGYAAGLAERDAAIDTALSQAVEHAGRLASEIGEVRDRVAADAERFVRAVLRAVLPSVADRATGLELASAITDTIRAARPRHDVAITLHPAVANAIERRLDSDAVPAGLTIARDPGLGPREAYLAWEGGGAEIDFSQPLQRCLAVLDGAPVVDLQAAGDGGDAGGIAVGRTAAHAAEDPETTDREGDTDERGESAA